MSSQSTNRKPNTQFNGVSNPIAGHILPPLTVQHLAREWIKEDSPTFDFSGFVAGEREATAVLLIKEAGVLAGGPFVDAIFKELECHVEWLYPEGSYLNPEQTIAIIKGRIRRLLLGERVALSCMCRASGVATLARKLALKAEGVGWKGELVDTRNKTTPGFRLVEKYALLVGGLTMHKLDLSSMISLNHNHIWTAGSITKAIKDARIVGGRSVKIEIECRGLEEAMEAGNAGCDVVLLDSLSAEVSKNFAESLKRRFPEILVEVCGDIHEENMVDFCCDWIDIISLQILTQGYAPREFALKMKKIVDPSLTESKS